MKSLDVKVAAISKAQLMKVGKAKPSNPSLPEELTNLEVDLSWRITHLKKYPEAKQTAEYHQALDILWKQYDKVSREIEHHIEEKRSIPARIAEPHPHTKRLQKPSADKYR